jgi:hypothetical protein
MWLLFAFAPKVIALTKEVSKNPILEFVLVVHPYEEHFDQV